MVGKSQIWLSNWTELILILMHIIVKFIYYSISIASYFYAPYAFISMLLSPSIHSLSMKFIVGHYLYYSIWNLANNIKHSKWQPSPAFLPQKSCRRRSVVGYSPRGCKDSNMTERLHFTPLWTTDDWILKILVNPYISHPIKID